MMESLPGYDDWKLASPYEGETDVDCDDFPDCEGCTEKDCPAYVVERDEDEGEDR